MIAYFDTSAIIPLIIDESGSTQCERFWNEATRVVSVRLVYAEARTALARAERMGRIDDRQLGAAVAQLEALLTGIDHVEVTEGLVRSAGSLAEDHKLRGYDAVHLAAALAVADDDFVLVAGDGALSTAALALGLGVATNA